MAEQSEIVSVFPVSLTSKSRRLQRSWKQLNHSLRQWFCSPYSVFLTLYLQLFFQLLCFRIPEINNKGCSNIPAVERVSANNPCEPKPFLVANPNFRGDGRFLHDCCSQQPCVHLERSCLYLKTRISFLFLWEPLQLE